MGKVIAAITTSVDGYIVGPKDGPEHGLGIGGERLHYWVMGGPWTYADDGRDTDGMHGADREYYESLTEGLGCGIVGRNMYDAAGAWGGTNPFPGTLIVLTHRTEDQPDPGAGFLFVDGFDAALMKARELAGDGEVSLGGGADLIRRVSRQELWTSSRFPPRRSCWAAGSGCSRDSSRISTSTCSALGVRSTPPTCGTPSGGPGRSTPHSDDGPVYATTRR
jgi:dihydrofolate reductase